MSLPVLAPALHVQHEASPVNSGTSRRPQSVLTHTQAEWETLYPEIERLYVRERWKLQAIMQFMESKHGFRATPQMYKKRFAKWGFQKNKKRWATADPTLSVLNLSCPQNDVKFMFLDSVRAWNFAFYEEPHKHLIPISPSVEANEINFAFKMIIELLDRGCGELAGRLARKAFLLIEDLLTIDGPALVWNLLDVMHHMAISHLNGTNPALPHHTTQLFLMLLVHLDALVVNKFKVPEQHPLSTMLRLLRRHTEANRAAVNGANNTTSPLKPNPEVVPLLEQAWNLNAKLIFENFDPKLLHLYWYISWDSCSINLPSHVTTLIIKRLKEMGLKDDRKQPRERTITPLVKTYLESEIAANRGYNPHHRHFPTPLLTDELPCSAMNPGAHGDTITKLQSNILTALREYGKHIAPFTTGVPGMGGGGGGGAARVSGSLNTSAATPEQTALLGTMAGLLATKVLDELQWEHTHCAGCCHGSEDETPPPSSPLVREQARTQMQRIQAMTAAWAIRIAATSNCKSQPPTCAFQHNGGQYEISHGGQTKPASTPKTDVPSDGNDKKAPNLRPEKVGHLRDMISLQEKATGRASLQAVREMWLLEDELLAAGKASQGKEANRAWRRRLEAYLGDIPVAEA